MKKVLIFITAFTRFVNSINFRH